MESIEGRNARRVPGRLAVWVRAGVVFLLVIAIDQASKRAVEHSIVPGEERHVLPGIQLVDTRNHGVAFGLFPNSPGIVIALICLALVALLWYFARNAGQRLVWWPTGMIVGGALGNILDRIRDNSVTDFIKLPLGWPPFNLADASIVVGIFILIIVIDRARAGER